MDLGAGVRLLEARLLDQEADRLLDRHLAPVHPHVQDDPAGAPDRVRVHVQAEVRGVIEALLPHHLLAVHAPALDEFRGLDHEPRERRMAAGDRQLEVMARVRLVDARVADRAVVVLAHRIRVVVDRRGDDVDAGRAPIELRRVEVGRKWDHVAQVLGRFDDLDPLVGRDRDDLVVDQVLARPNHDLAVGVQRLREGRRVVALDPIDDGRLVD